MTCVTSYRGIGFFLEISDRLLSGKRVSPEEMKQVHPLQLMHIAKIAREMKRATNPRYSLLETSFYGDFKTLALRGGTACKGSLFFLFWQGKTFASFVLKKRFLIEECVFENYDEDLLVVTAVKVKNSFMAFVEKEGVALDDEELEEIEQKPPRKISGSCEKFGRVFLREEHSIYTIFASIQKSVLQPFEEILRNRGQTEEFIRRKFFDLISS